VIADSLVAGVRAGLPAAAARLISLVEHGSPVAADALSTLFPLTGRARIVGVTGPPGAGKSTLVDALVRCYRQRRERVGVIAVDPSSPFTGGALLGDRIRMRAHAEDPGVFIRSMATRGELGGLSAAAASAVRVLDAFGLDVVIVETVGVGQSELAVADLADCVVLVCAPGTGDGVQAVKAGVMEIGDVFVVNKSDHPDAGRTRLDIARALELRGGTPGPVLLVRADQGEGVEVVVGAVQEHIERARQSGALAHDRETRLERESLSLIARLARREVVDRLGDTTVEALRRDLAERRLDPARVAAVAVTTAFAQGGAQG